MLEPWRVYRAQLDRNAAVESPLWQHVLVQTAQQTGISKLYHYEPFKAEYLEDTLAKKRIHVSNIKNVNDPWDCRPWFDVDVSDPTRRREWADRLRPLVEASEDLMRKIATFKQPWEADERFLTLTISSLMKNNHAINIERWRMYCLTCHVNSILMWSHYAFQHTGICLEFNTEGNFFSKALKVTYCKSLPVITADLFADQNALTQTILLTKSDEWSYENEYRLLVRDGEVDPQFSVTCHDEFVSLPDQALTAVIAGPKCSDASIEGIQRLITKHAPHVQLKRAVCVPHKYEISVSPHETIT